MEKKIEKCSLAIISKLPQVCKPNEFMVAYFIITTMAIKKNDRVKIYRGKLADQCSMTERNISRISERLNDIGIIKKELIGDAEKKKTYNYYCLNWQFIDEFLAKFDNEDDTFLPELSGLKNRRTKELKENKELKKTEESEELSDKEILAMLEEKKKNSELHYACSATNETDDVLPF